MGSGRINVPYLIGLTGGIGSGKSTVCNLFTGLGVPVIDADVVAREVVAPGQPALEKIKAAFGQVVISTDGTLMRDVLRQIVFADNAKRERLESIVHPLVYAEMLSRAARLTDPYCILCVPLLIETGQTDRVKAIIVVDVPRELQIQRVMTRDRSTREQIEAVLRTQATRQQRLSVADEVINNNDGEAQLRPQVVKLHQRLLENVCLKMST